MTLIDVDEMFEEEDEPTSEDEEFECENMCNEGDLDCDDCNGQGTIEQDCEKCTDGYVETHQDEVCLVKNHDTCYESCDECNGIGNVSPDCDDCNGTGIVPCPDCDGIIKPSPGPAPF